MNASLVKELREKTGAGILDCNKALKETNGNIEEAIDFLRKKGLSNAAKKSGNVTTEGATAVKIFNNNIGVITEVNTQTDFVSKNELFHKLVTTILDSAQAASDLDSLLVTPMANGSTLEQHIQEHIGTIGENLSLSRFAKLQVESGAVVSYVHSQFAPGIGKISVLVALKADTTNSDHIENIKELGSKIAMHIAAANPTYLSVDMVPSKLIENEKEIFIEQARNSGKPEAIIEKMVQGRIQKFYEETVLLEQISVVDESRAKISELLDQLSKKIGTKVEIQNFIKYVVGEGKQVEKTNFADEVKSILQ